MPIVPSAALFSVLLFVLSLSTSQPCPLRNTGTATVTDRPSYLWAVTSDDAQVETNRYYYGSYFLDDNSSHNVIAWRFGANDFFLANLVKGGVWTLGNIIDITVSNGIIYFLNDEGTINTILRDDFISEQTNITITPLFSGSIKSIITDSSEFLYAVDGADLKIFDSTNTLVSTIAIPPDVVNIAMDPTNSSTIWGVIPTTDQIVEISISDNTTTTYNINYDIGESIAVTEDGWIYLVGLGSGGEETTVLDTIIGVNALNTTVQHPWNLSPYTCTDPTDISYSSIGNFIYVACRKESMIYRLKLCGPGDICSQDSECPFGECVDDRCCPVCGKCSQCIGVTCNVIDDCVYESDPLPGVDVLLRFAGYNPSHKVVPIFKKKRLENLLVTAAIQKVDEVSENGTIVKSVVFPDTFDIEPHSGVGKEIVDLNATVDDVFTRFSFGMSEDDYLVDYGNKSFTVKAGVLKWSFVLGSWPFSGNNNLQIHVLLSSNDGQFKNPLGPMDDNIVQTLRTERTEIIFDLQDIAVVDDTNVISVKVSGQFTTQGLAVTLTVPYLGPGNHTLFYDPNMEVLVSGQNNDGGDGDGDDDAILAAIIVPVVVGSCLICSCVIVVVVLTVTFFSRRNMRNKLLRQATDAGL